jgi:TonB family protein
LSQAFGVRPNTLTNGFFTKSLIKKRILMLHKQRSKKTAILKYGMFVPLFALTLVLSSATIRKNNQILAIADKIPLNNLKLVVDQAIERPLSMVNLAQTPPAILQEEQPTQIVTLVPTANSENENASALSAFYSYLGSKIKYPINAIEKKLKGNTIINFTVKNGKITDAIAHTELGEGCDEEVIAEIMSYDDYFQNDGNYSLKVTFKLNGVEGALKNENANPSISDNALQNIVITAMPITKELETDRTVYNFVSIEQPPTYPGGIEQFYRFLGNNIKYPAAAVDNEIQGNVHVSFTVEKDGSLTDIKVERKLGFGIDEEALRVVKLAKKWNPGMQNGRSVRVRYNIPVKFSLDMDVPERKAKTIASIRLKTYTEKDEPMVVIDNEIKTYNYLKAMDSKNIESINVLSGPNAVFVYGKAAENGALIVKSKNYKPKLITATLNNKN